MAHPSALPTDVEHLLRTRIRSLTQLEALLLLRAGPRSAADVARALRITEAHAEDELTSLVAVRLAAAEGSRYRYATTPRIRATVDVLAPLYPTYRVAIAAAMFSELRDRRRRSRPRR
jgi:predicted transcriptional regulator